MPKAQKQSEVAAAYDLWAASYDVDDNQTRVLAGDVLRQRQWKPAQQVIEIGCGTGRNTAWLAERAGQVTAIDFSQGMLEQARAHVTAANVEFAQHDIRTEWPIAAGSADLVVAMLVLEHIEKLPSVFAEAARVLRPGGRFWLCELHPVRQMMGKQAKFSDPQTGELKRIAAYLHDMSEYVNGGVDAALQLVHMGEWRDDGDGPSDPPRLLSLEFEAQGAGRE